MMYLLIESNVYAIANFNFYLYVSLIFVMLFVEKKLSLGIIWLVGILFVVIPEMLLYSKPEYLKITRHIIAGNNIFLLGYFTVRNQITENQDSYDSYRIKLRSEKSFVLSLVLLLGFYLYCSVPNAIATVTIGRYTADFVAPEKFSHIAAGLGSTLPSFFSWYFLVFRKKQNLSMAFLFSLPIFIVIFLQGSRFPLLFSVLGFVFSGHILGTTINRRNLIKLGSIAGVFIVSGMVMLSLRTLGQHSRADTEIDEVDYTLSQRISTNFTVEGIVDMNSNIYEYCNKEGFSYGVNTAFPLYFWIPRSLWNDKPKMLGGLLPEYLGGYAKGYSTSTGIWGEFYVDYGYYSFILFFVLGVLMHKLSNKTLSKLDSKSKSPIVIIYAFIFSYIFFSVRSPITSTVKFITIALMYWVIVKLFIYKKRIVNNETENKRIIA